jgi:hypothetical protein
MKNETTRFEDWYEANEPEDEQDRGDLMLSVEGATTAGNYTTEEKNGQLFVFCGTGDVLRLASEKARAEFLRYVKEAKVPDDIDLDFQRAMEDPKS